MVNIKKPKNSESKKKQIAGTPKNSKLKKKQEQAASTPRLFRIDDSPFFNYRSGRKVGTLSNFSDSTLSGIKKKQNSDIKIGKFNQNYFNNRDNQSLNTSNIFNQNRDNRKSQTIINNMPNQNYFNNRDNQSLNTSNIFNQNRDHRKSANIISISNKFEKFGCLPDSQFYSNDQVNITNNRLRRVRNNYQNYPPDDYDDDILTERNHLISSSKKAKKIKKKIKKKLKNDGRYCKLKQDSNSKTPVRPTNKKKFSLPSSLSNVFSFDFLKKKKI